MAARTVVLVAACAAAGALVLATDGAAASHAAAQAGPDLTRLLRAMAAMKLLMAAAAMAAIWWRLATPAPGWRLALYAAAAAGMASGPVLIWAMIHVGSGALLLHAGLVGVVALLWLDPEVGRRLELLVARKRAGLRG